MKCREELAGVPRTMSLRRCVTGDYQVAAGATACDDGTAAGTAAHDVGAAKGSAGVYAILY